MPPFCEEHQKYLTDCIEEHLRTAPPTWYARLHINTGLVVDDAVEAASMALAMTHFLSKFPGAVEAQVWREDR